MDSSTDKDWKKKLGFPINYDSDDDDFDSNDVVMRHPRKSSKFLLEESGDGSEADLLGTTPPRARIRDKEKRRNIMLDVGGISSRTLAEARLLEDVQSPTPPERLKKRSSLKLIRSKERDWKLDIHRDSKADSLPSPSPAAAIPTLVESCSRFMSLTSKLKCREADACEEAQLGWPDEAVPSSRTNFHNTFSMLINMGNIEKGCRRTISREEQVWQNELKDLIWLELKAKLAGRSLAQQDDFLCRQRRGVPAAVQRILDYQYEERLRARPLFENPNPCRKQSRRLSVIQGSNENLAGAPERDKKDEAAEPGCVSLECERCSAAVGAAMRQVYRLLSAYDAAVALYPSSSAAAADHSALASPQLAARLRAMCLWFNTAHHMRLKLLSVRRMLRPVRARSRRALSHLSSVDSSGSRKSSINCPKPCQVRFNVESTTSDSNNSDTSGHSEGQSESKDSGSDNQDKDGSEKSDVQSSHKLIIGDGEGPLDGIIDVQENSNNRQINLSGSNDDRRKNGNDNIETDLNELLSESEGTKDLGTEKAGGDVTDSAPQKIEHIGDSTPEVVVSEACGTYDTSASSESGYASGGERDDEDVFDIGPLRDVTELRLLGRVAISQYRDYHHEMLKTHGVRRCFSFMNKMRKKLLYKACLTLQEPLPEPSDSADDMMDFGEEKKDIPKTEEESDAMDMYEFRRYGCWSEESLAMRLPSYRNHFLLLHCLGMEAVHDYLALRMEGRPDQPSCLTIKQLIHELKEGLDIATETRAAFARDVAVALRGWGADEPARAQLLLILRTFDATVDTAVQQYLSYLCKLSETEVLPRARLAPELAFAARLAARVPLAAAHAHHAFVDMACNQINRQLKRFEDRFQTVMDIESKGISEELEEKYVIYAICREAQHVYTSERDSTLQTAQWARVLAARLPPHRDHVSRLFESLMHLRGVLVGQTELMLQRSAALVELPRELRDTIGARARELLLQVYKLGFELHVELHQFAQAPFRALARPRPRARPASLQPARAPPPARPRRPGTILLHDTCNPLIHKELHRFVNETPPVSITPRNTRGLVNRARLLRSESIGEEESSVLEQNNFTKSGQNDIEALLAGRREPPPQPERVEPPCEALRREAELAQRVARAIIEFAKCWMTFVVKRCDRGRGLRPRWASQGLEFLMLACDPCNTKHLSDEEFEALKQLMDGCISHVVGSRDAAPPSPAPPHRQRPRLHPNTLSSSSSKDGTAPPTPPSDLEIPPVCPAEPYTDHGKRVVEAIRALDAARDESLRAANAVGRVLEAAVRSYEPKLRQLTFKWQRGLKIGAGSFGKVYTVVNTASGQVLAMKEISVAAGDRRALQRAANELRVLEGVLHPHLVRYYGCELHREEMLLFMELCVEGSLEALVATSGALAEQTTRRYTKQLLSAVQELHERAIAHRDIKSGNIFLTNEGHCLKLGDFGCAVKIRANTTAPGELQGFVGTQAYMAPEVFMKSSGHGRAADIWSLGCVVTEMASGKRPFSEYDSNYQIMFVVGMGDTPHVPDSLSEEGQQFCRSCLTHNPELRPRAEALSLHHFLKVKSDDDCKCEPAFLIT